MRLTDEERAEIQKIAEGASRCREGCPTKDCGSYAACLKAARLQIGRLR